MPEGAPVIVAGIRITNPERVLYEEMGITKAALARYYEGVAEWMLPELRRRPLSLVRCPQGPGEGCFYQKNIDEKFPADIERVPVDLGGGGLYAAASSVSAVVGLVQMGVIEMDFGGHLTFMPCACSRYLDIAQSALVAWSAMKAAPNVVNSPRQGSSGAIKLAIGAERG